jgi:hypothetical protein
MATGEIFYQSTCQYKVLIQGVWRWVKEWDLVTRDLQTSTNKSDAKVFIKKVSFNPFKDTKVAKVDELLGLNYLSRESIRTLRELYPVQIIQEQNGWKEVTPNPIVSSPGIHINYDGSLSMALVWNDQTGTDFYDIKIRMNGVDYTPPAGIVYNGVSSPLKLDSQIISENWGKTISFQLVCRNTEGKKVYDPSSFTQTYKVELPPAPPTGFKLEKLDIITTKVIWNKLNDGTKYSVLYGLSPVTTSTAIKREILNSGDSIEYTKWGTILFWIQATKNLMVSYVGPLSVTQSPPGEPAVTSQGNTTVDIAFSSVINFTTIIEICTDASFYVYNKTNMVTGQTSHKIKGLNPGDKIYIRVRYVKNGFEYVTGMITAETKKLDPPKLTTELESKKEFARARILVDWNSINPTAGDVIKVKYGYNQYRMDYEGIPVSGSKTFEITNLDNQVRFYVCVSYMIEGMEADSEFSYIETPVTIQPVANGTENPNWPVWYFENAWTVPGRGGGVVSRNGTSKLYIKFKGHWPIDPEFGSYEVTEEWFPYQYQTQKGGTLKSFTFSNYHYDGNGLFSWTMWNEYESSGFGWDITGIDMSETYGGTGLNYGEFMIMASVSPPVIYIPKIIIPPVQIKYVDPVTGKEKKVSTLPTPLICSAW